MKHGIWIGALGVGCVVGIVLLWRIGLTDTAAAPRLSLPPAPLTAAQLEGRQLLFDGATATGWMIEGPHHIENATLVLGGVDATTATLERVFEMGEEIEFAYFQEGGAGASLRIKASPIDSQEEFADQSRDLTSDLTLAGYVYKRWHATTIHCTHDSGHVDLRVAVQPLHDDLGKTGRDRVGFPSAAGCRYQVIFEIPAGSTLYLRNVVLEEFDTPATQ